jgi:DNA-binding beta-propeller fold protein YncE
VTTYAGDGTFGATDGFRANSSFSYPVGLAFDAWGNLYVTDSGSNKVRKITASNGQVTTVAGSGAYGFLNGLGLGASFSSPFAIVVNPLGVMFVADTYGQMIRKIATDGVVTTFAGNGTAGYADGPADKAMFKSPIGIAIDPHRQLVCS